MTKLWLLITHPGIPFFIKAGYCQIYDKLELYYNHIFEWATPESTTIDAVAT